MKILFTGINARYIHSNLAILYLKKAVSDLPFKTAVSEFTINEAPGKIIERIVAEKPDVVIFSVYIWNSLLIKSLLPLIKQRLPDVLIVAGGPDVSYNPDEWLKLHPEIDYIITGGGEAGFRELALSGFSLSGEVISRVNPRFSDIPFPYDDREMKRLSGRFIYYESSRGCPFKCSYCLSSRSDQKPDFRSIEQVEEELGFLISYKPRIVKFVDRTFNSRREHYRGIWEYILKKITPGSTLFHFEIYPDLLDRDDVEFLRTVPAGLFQFEMGVQSLNDETLAAIRRGKNREGWMDNIKAVAAKGNIHLHVDLIAGLPYESFTGFRNSFDTVYSLGAEHFQCGFLKVLPGTEMRERAEDFGLEYDSAPPYQVRKNSWISMDEMTRLRDMAELVEVYHNSGRFCETVKFLIEGTGSPFTFYEKLSVFKMDERDLNIREWEGAAQLLIKYAAREGAPDIQILRDFLRWDWCSSMKLHHYPGLLKSEATVIAKRRGYNYIKQFLGNSRLVFNNIEFGADELRRSIFFTAESEYFRNRMMVRGYAMFLPDGRTLFFDIE